MQGRWTILADSEKNGTWIALGPGQEAHLVSGVPVVPCDDAAIERAVKALRKHDMPGPEDVTRWIVEIVFDAAAGKTISAHCTCGWTGPDWAIAKEHVVAAMRANETAERPVVHVIYESKDA